MGDFLSLLGAAFDSQYGFIMWSCVSLPSARALELQMTTTITICRIAYWRLHREELWKGPIRSVLTVVHIVIFFVGLFLLGPGMYAAVEAVVSRISACL